MAIGCEKHVFCPVPRQHSCSRDWLIPSAPQTDSKWDQDERKLGRAKKQEKEKRMAPTHSSDLLLLFLKSRSTQSVRSGASQYYLWCSRCSTRSLWRHLITSHSVVLKLCHHRRNQRACEMQAHYYLHFQLYLCAVATKKAWPKQHFLKWTHKKCYVEGKGL